MKRVAASTNLGGLNYLDLAGSDHGKQPSKTKRVPGGDLHSPNSGDLAKSIKSDKTLLDEFDLTDIEKDHMYECVKSNIIDITYDVRFNIKINSLDINGKQQIINYLKLLETTFNEKPYVKSIPIYILEFKKINEYKLEQVIAQTKKKLDSLEKDKVMVLLDIVEKYTN